MTTFISFLFKLQVCLQCSSVENCGTIFHEGAIILAIQLPRKRSPSPPDNGTNRREQISSFHQLSSDVTSEVWAVKKHLSSHLPHYCLPDTVVAVATIPMTSHGKLDKRKLLENILQLRVKMSSGEREYIIGNGGNLTEEDVVNIVLQQCKVSWYLDWHAFPERPHLIASRAMAKPLIITM